MIASAARFTGDDCSKDLQDLDEQIRRAFEELPRARENLQEARARLALRKRALLVATIAGE